jgi:hypothetical protein
MREHVDEEIWQDSIQFKNGHGIIKPSYTHWTVAYALTLEGISFSNFFRNLKLNLNDLILKVLKSF